MLLAAQPSLAESGVQAQSQSVALKRITTDMQSAIPQTPVGVRRVIDGFAIMRLDRGASLAMITPNGYHLTVIWKADQSGTSTITAPGSTQQFTVNIPRFTVPSAQSRFSPLVTHQPPPQCLHNKNIWITQQQEIINGAQIQVAINLGACIAAGIVSVGVEWATLGLGTLGVIAQDGVIGAAFAASVISLEGDDDELDTLEGMPAC
jgi:hypothetical protein